MKGMRAEETAKVIGLKLSLVQISASRLPGFVLGSGPMLAEPLNGGQGKGYSSNLWKGHVIT